MSAAILFFHRLSDYRKNDGVPSFTGGPPVPRQKVRFPHPLPNSTFWFIREHARRLGQRPFGASSRAWVSSGSGRASAKARMSPVMLELELEWNFTPRGFREQAPSHAPTSITHRNGVLRRARTRQQRAGRDKRTCTLHCRAAALSAETFLEGGSRIGQIAHGRSNSAQMEQQVG